MRIVLISAGRVAGDTPANQDLRPLPAAGFPCAPR